nr:PREDICTED: putative odorant-binding protein A5 [Bemisia tabaci]XP_018903747.1 PREDICTED: putative odorant-binding protein A5 [Bemisia tabaci]
MEKLLVAVLSFISLAICSDSNRPMTRAEVKTMLKHHDVVPKIIDESENVDQLVVTFNYTVVLDADKKLTPEQIENKPTMLDWPVADNDLYSLVFIEPEHPTKARKKHYYEFVHWLVVNIPGTQIDKGNEIIEYVGYRAFYEDKEPHRLIFLAYKQPSSDPMEFNITKLIPEQLVERWHHLNFTARKFAADYDLTGPTAVNLGVIDCEQMWHGEKYKVFKNDSDNDFTDLPFPEDLTTKAPTKPTL